jgi:hypothetical protein
MNIGIFGALIALGLLVLWGSSIAATVLLICAILEDRSGE